MLNLNNLNVDRVLCLAAESGHANVVDWILIHYPSLQLEPALQRAISANQLVIANKIYAEIQTRTLRHRRMIEYCRRNSLIETVSFCENHNRDLDDHMIEYCQRNSLIETVSFCENHNRELHD